MRGMECGSRKMENNRGDEWGREGNEGRYNRVNGARLARATRAKLSDNRQI